MSDPVSIRSVLDEIVRAQKIYEARGDDPREAARAEREQQAAIREQRAQRLTESGIAVTADDFDAIVGFRLKTTPALECVLRWINVVTGSAQSKHGKPMRFLALLGLPGAGKTVGAGVALAEIGGRYVTADAVRRAFCFETDEAQQLRRKLLHGGFIVIDDVGTEQDDTGARFALQELVNQRQGHGRHTLITGNLTRDQFEKRYDSRTIDRILHQGSIVEIKGESLRKK